MPVIAGSDLNTGTIVTVDNDTLIEVDASRTEYGDRYTVVAPIAKGQEVAFDAATVAPGAPAPKRRSGGRGGKDKDDDS